MDIIELNADIRTAEYMDDYARLADLIEQRDALLEIDHIVEAMT